MRPASLVFRLSRSQHQAFSSLCFYIVEKFFQNAVAPDLDVFEEDRLEALGDGRPQLK